MKKFILTAVAFAALSGVAVASERDHDMRLSEPSYTQTNADAPQILFNKFSVVKSDAGTSDTDARRLDEKNGSRG